MRLNKEQASRLVSWKPLWLLSLVLLFQFSGCTTTRTEDDDTTNTFVRIIELRAEDDAQGTDLFSDVCVADPATPSICTVTNDDAIVTMSVRPKDLTQPLSFKQDIIFTRYRVTYIRADGRNVPGVDTSPIPSTAPPPSGFPSTLTVSSGCS